MRVPRQPGLARTVKGGGVVAGLVITSAQDRQSAAKAREQAVSRRRADLALCPLPKMREITRTQLGVLAAVRVVLKRARYYIRSADWCLQPV
jgi:hypothetical protein